MTPKEGRTGSIARPAMQDVRNLCIGKPGVISLAQGVPRISPSRKAVDAAIARMDASTHVYAPDPGIPELREMLARDYGARKGLATAPENILVTCGANQAFFIALQAATRPGDRVALFAPYYFNYRMAVELSGCEPVILPRGGDGQPDLGALAQALESGVRVVATVSPDNPTGVVHRPELQRALARMCSDAGAWLLSDEVYEDFAYDLPHESCARHAPDSVITLHSFSKSFGISGWRVGYLRAPERLMDGLVKAQDTLAISAPTISQLLAIECLKAGRSEVATEAARLRFIRNLFRDSTADIPGVSAYPMQGAFYSWLKLDSVDGWSAVKYLIERHGVAVAPGEPFGVAPAVRVSYGNVSDEEAPEAASRLSAGLREICARSMTRTE